MESKEKVLPEAATPEQDNQVKPLYTDLSISKRIMQVLIPTMEIIRILGDSERRFTYEFCAGGTLVVYECKWLKDDEYKHKFVRKWIDIIIDTNCFDHDRIVKDLDAAIDTMTDLLGSIRKELGYAE